MPLIEDKLNAGNNIYPIVEAFTVAALPKPYATDVGRWVYVTDATVTTAGTAPVGGGSYRIAVWNSGKAWYII